jgi:hypothetical protein
VHKKYQQWILASADGKQGWLPSSYVNIPDQEKEMRLAASKDNLAALAGDSVILNVLACFLTLKAIVRSHKLNFKNITLSLQSIDAFDVHLTFIFYDDNPSIAH